MLCIEIMQKLLLTGSNGFLATHFYNLLQNKYRIIGLYHNAKNEAITESYKADLQNIEALKQLLHLVKPSIIVHTAAISSIARCEANEAYAYAINVTATAFLATYCAVNNIAFVFCSTDLVFDGIKGNYTETDLPNPINIYGEQKYIAEQKVITANKNALIVRLPLMIGENKKGFAGVIAELRYKEQHNEPAFLFTNEYRSVALVDDVVNGINLLLQKKQTGTFHLAGANIMSRWDIGNYIKKAHKLSQLHIVATTHQEKNISNRPANVSFNIDKMKKLGYLPKSLV